MKLRMNKKSLKKLSGIELLNKDVTAKIGGARQSDAYSRNGNVICTSHNPSLNIA